MEQFSRFVISVAGEIHHLNSMLLVDYSEIHSLERIEIIQDLRLGEYDDLVGVNLFREVLDLLEVSLVAILDG